MSTTYQRGATRAATGGDPGQPSLQAWTTPRRVGFVSTRIAGVDGVSLEIAKWATILERHGCQCFYVAGELDRPAERSHLVEEAHFAHPAIRQIHDEIFGQRRRPRALSDHIYQTSRRLKQHLYDAVERLGLELIIAENCLTIPMNIPLGIALVELVLETDIPCIAHHHDFVWERERFRVHAAVDFMEMAFPPRIAEIEHVVINTLAQEEFTRRLGLGCTVIPNIMDFANPPQRDGGSEGLRAQIGVSRGETMVLQPTRLIQRKGIEHTVELVKRLGPRSTRMVLAYDGGDEGHGYARRVREYADMLWVDTIFAHPWIGTERGANEDGSRRYTAWDAYAEADLIAYPSAVEGFGNAFLEAVYFKKPVFCNRYPVFRTDIEPLGFKVGLMDGYLTEEVVTEVRRQLHDAEYREHVVEHNYDTARAAFSYEAVEPDVYGLITKRRTVAR